MYKFARTLTDPDPWIKHFSRIAESTTSWQPTPENSVVILKDYIKGKGVEDTANNKIALVNPIEQFREQAASNLARDIRENNSNLQPKSQKRKSHTSAKKSAVKVTRKTKDIFSKYRARKNE